MDPFYFGHQYVLIRDIHDWIYYHHVWAVPLIAFLFTMIVSLCTMKLYLWWKFDRKKGGPKWKSINKNSEKDE